MRVLFSEPMLYISLKFAISVIVYACPCSLALAVPTANVVGIGVGAAVGVLIKSGDAFESGSTINHVVFDKTGTLTTGKMKICTFGFAQNSPISKEHLFSAIVAIEGESTHPVASIISSYVLEELGKQPFSYAVSQFKAIPGCGVEARVVLDATNYELKIGNLSWIVTRAKESSFYDTVLATELQFCLSQGKCVIGISVNDVVSAFFILFDFLKHDASATIQALSKEGKQITIISGDSYHTVAHFANVLQVHQALGQVTPIGKSDAVVRFRNAGDRVCMVGDGINDAPALAASNLGISVCNASDFASQSADVILLNQNLRGVCDMLQLCKIVSRTIRWNVFWSVAYNSIGLPIAMGLFYPKHKILLDPMVAGFLMSLSSIMIVFSSLSIRLVFEKTRKPLQHSICSKKKSVFSFLKKFKRSSDWHALPTLGGSATLLSNNDTV